MSEQGRGKRRPQADDLDNILVMVRGGKSLVQTCAALGLDEPSTHKWLNKDEGRSQSYAHAREGRADSMMELALTVSMAAATKRKINIDGQQQTIDPQGARVYVDTVKWAAARMAPKTTPVQRLQIENVTNLTDAEIDAELARLASGEEPEAEEA